MIRSANYSKSFPMNRKARLWLGATVSLSCFIAPRIALAEPISLDCRSDKGSPFSIEIDPVRGTADFHPTVGDTESYERGKKYTAGDGTPCSDYVFANGNRLVFGSTCGQAEFHYEINRNNGILKRTITLLGTTFGKCERASSTPKF